MEKFQIPSWDALAALVDMHKMEKWIFRGVARTTYKLIPKIGRTTARSKEQGLAYKRDDEIRIFQEFKRRAKPQVNPETDLEWLALAQHHGLCTRLLDWTESLFVAAFFATEQGIDVESDPYTYPAIYGIKGLDEVGGNAEQFGMGDSVKVYRPPYVSERIQPQRGVFTVHENPSIPFDHHDLVRWELRMNGTLDMKLALDAAGITRETLFPGVDGLADSLNWRYKWGIL